MTDLNDKCAPCDGWVPPLTVAQISDYKAKLNSDWILDSDAKSLKREFKFKGFAKAVMTANLAAYISDKEGHHADISFGWGYCHITFTSHELGRLSENDFICASKVDLAVG